MPSEFQVTTVAFGDVPGFGFWLDEHYRQHLRYNDALAKRVPPVIVPVFDILTVPESLKVMRFWLDSHEKWHELIRPFANVTGLNLADVDFTQPGQFLQWLDVHAQEHAEIDLALGVA